MKKSLGFSLLLLLAVAAGCDKKSDEAASLGEPTTAGPKAAEEAKKASQAAAAADVVAPSPPQRRPAAPLNVIFLTIDALRADMPWTTYEKPIAPNLTELAKKSIVYENHRSVSSYTAQTVATLMSGRYASTLYRTGTFFTNYSEANEWITERMQSKGVTTMAVHAHLYFDRAKGLRQGFDTWQMVPGLTWNSETDESVTSPKSVESLLKLLEEPKNVQGQFFLWSHLMDPHDKYVKHKESPDFGDKNRGRYDSEVWYTDFWVGKLLDHVTQAPYASKTAIIISADHGEAFGEHGMHKHAFEIWDVLVRVPLIFYIPDANPRRIDALRSHIDVAPTILDLMGLPPLDGFQGKSLVPEIYGADPDNREPILLELAEDSHNAGRQAIVLGEHKLIVWDSGKKALFNLKSDPGEEKDLSGELPDKTKELLELLKSRFTELPTVRPYGGSTLKSGKSANGPKGPAAREGGG